MSDLGRRRDLPEKRTLQFSLPGRLEGKECRLFQFARYSASELESVRQSCCPVCPSFSEIRFQNQFSFDNGHQHRCSATWAANHRSSPHSPKSRRVVTSDWGGFSRRFITNWACDETVRLPTASPPELISDLSHSAIPRFSIHRIILRPRAQPLKEVFH